MTNRVLVMKIGAKTRFGLYESTPTKGVQLMAWNEDIAFIEQCTKDNFIATIVENTSKLLDRFGKDLKDVPTIVLLDNEIVNQRFVKISPIMKKSSHIKQIIDFEVKPNISYTIDEACYTSRMISTNSRGYNYSLLMAERKNVKQILDMLKSHKLDVRIITGSNDYAGQYMYSTVRFNSEDYNVTALFDEIDTTVIMYGSNGYFIRNVPVGIRCLTYQVAKDLSISFEQATDLVSKHFYVLGQTIPLDENTARIAKIARNVMTRIYTETVRSMNVYRTINDIKGKCTNFSVQHPVIAENMQEFFDEKFKGNASTIKCEPDLEFWQNIFFREAVTFIADPEGEATNMNLLNYKPYKAPYDFGKAIRSIRKNIASGIHGFANLIEG